MTVRGGGVPAFGPWLSCRGEEWVRRLGASRTDAYRLHHGFGLKPAGYKDAARFSFPRCRSRAPLENVIPTGLKRAAVLGAVKMRPGNAGAWGEAIATADPDSPCARPLVRTAGRGEGTGFQVEQGNWDEESEWCPQESA
jgi:hypothetical protein